MSQELLEAVRGNKIISAPCFYGVRTAVANVDYVPTPIWVCRMDTPTWAVYKSMVDMVSTIIIFCRVLEEYAELERLYHDISFLRALHTHFSDALAPDFPALLDNFSFSPLVIVIFGFFFEKIF